MNFYQTVKGISAAAQVTESGGTIIVVSECGNGLPGNSDFDQILSQNLSTDDLLNEIMNGQNVRQDQWQVQVLLQILKRYNVCLYSAMDSETAKRTRVEPVFDIEKKVKEIRKFLEIDRLPIAVMPYGPLTIPMC